MSSFLASRAPLATVEELAAYCRTGKDWIEKGLKSRELPFTMVGRQYRFTEEQVDAILAMKAEGVAIIPTRDEVAERRQRRGAA